MAHDAGDLFGEESDSEDEAKPSKRPPDCGVLSFHAGVEEAMLLFVEQRVKGSGGAAAVLSAVDEFCVTRHWMMHVGPKKGAIFEGAVDLARRCRWPGGSDGLFVLEFGSYCGYSAVLLSTLLGHPEDRIVTIEVEKQAVGWARRLLALAGIANRVEVIHGDASKACEIVRQRGAGRGQEPANAASVASVGFDCGKSAAGCASGEGVGSPGGGEQSAAFSQQSEEGYRVVDLLFLDHEKRRYLPDLLLAETLLVKGAVVVADNITCFDKGASMAPYLAHVRESNGAFASSVFYESEVEYSLDEGHEDGVEVSVYGGHGQQTFS